MRLGQNSGSPKTQVQAKTQLFHGKTQVPVSLRKNLFLLIKQVIHKLLHRKRKFDVNFIFWENSGSNFAKPQIQVHQNSGSKQQNSGSKRENLGFCITR